MTVKKHRFLISISEYWTGRLI